jgi:DNA primase
LADERDEIRSRIDIVELVGREIHLTQQGKTWKGLCPFHQDKNPSFTVSRQTGRYKCWSCGEAGDIFTWVMKRQNVEFADAIRTLAKEAGVTLTSRGPQAPPSVRQAQDAAMDEALAFFRDHLGKSSIAREYCERRGLDEETLNAWEIGYAPEVSGALAVHLKKKGFTLAECKTLFLVDDDSQGGYFDKFRGRLMFPIRDEKGALVAFGGRLLGDGVPKYINSSDTPLYRKSKVLYGMSRARNGFGKNRQAILVEGYLDVIACHRAGVTGALASLGTALSEDHAKLLKRWVEEVVILYDSDAAGQKAADRAVGILAAEGLRVRVALMPQGEDPDTLLRNAGPGAVRQAVDAGLSPLDYKMQALELRKPQLSGEEFWNSAVLLLSDAPTEMELDRHLLRLAGQYPGIPDVTKAQQALRREVNKIRRRNRDKPEEAVRVNRSFQPNQLRGELSTAELVVFKAFLSLEYRKSGWMFARVRDLFASNLALNISDAITQAFPNAAPEGEPALWLHQFEDEQMRETMADLTLDNRGDHLTENFISDTVELLKQQREKRKLNQIRKGNLDTAKRQEYLLKLREHKPDTLKKQQSDDSLFG